MRTRHRALTALAGLTLVLGGVTACSEEDQRNVEERVEEGVQEGAEEVEQQVEEGAEEPSEASPS